MSPASRYDEPHDSDIEQIRASPDHFEYEMPSPPKRKKKKKKKKFLPVIDEENPEGDAQASIGEEIIEQDNIVAKTEDVDDLEGTGGTH